jgi:hypothetical protein
MSIYVCRFWKAWGFFFLAHQVYLWVCCVFIYIMSDASIMSRIVQASFLQWRFSNISYLLLAPSKEVQASLMLNQIPKLNQTLS